jgi:phosphosulfolactate synthase (CoM biosynthesis protein A)
MPEKAVCQMVEVARKHDVYVSTGGFIERVLATSNNRERDVEKYVRRCKDLGFDTIELSTGFLSMPVDDWAALMQLVQRLGLKAKPELGIQWGAGGDARVADLESAGTSDVGGLIDAGKRLIDAGVEMLMIESEGITENVKSWRTGTLPEQAGVDLCHNVSFGPTDVLSSIIRELPLTKLMFEAADPKVFEWYIQNHGVDVNLFVDHTHAV